MKILLIGPVPPPHGGISVHVIGIHRELMSRGIPCLVLDPGRVRNKLRFLKTVLRYAAEGWTIHFHTNGHNRKSWLLALLCGLSASARGTTRLLTLHSGMAPGYLRGGLWRRRIAAAACNLYDRIICVSAPIQESVVSLGVEPARTEIAPACLGAQTSNASLNSLLLSWIARHEPILSTALFFRPEYGFNLLVTAVARLRESYPAIGCLVMGGGEQHEEAMARIHEARLEDSILLLGDVEHEECLAIMARSDVFVRTTLEDGDSISVREALALGVPVVASRVGTRPEGAILFQPGNLDEMLAQVQQAIDAPAMRSTGGSNSMGRLLGIYRQAMPPEGFYVST